jgi:adenylylsulfate reductase subunit B
MGIRVDRDLCNGCGTLEEPLCVRDCPGDLMVLDVREGKAFIRDNGECWDCAACVKVCPTQAIEMSLATTIAVPGVSLKGRALRSKTLWTVRLRDGTVRTYATPSRGKIPFTPSI